MFDEYRFRIQKDCHIHLEDTPRRECQHCAPPLQERQRNRIKHPRKPPQQFQAGIPPSILLPYRKPLPTRTRVWPVTATTEAIVAAPTLGVALVYPPRLPVLPNGMTAEHAPQYWPRLVPTAHVQPL